LLGLSIKKIQNGEFVEIGRGINNEIIVDDIDTDHVMAIPGDIWKISSHDSTQYGSRLLNNILKEKRFTFPKSLYAVKDAIRFVTANKKNALIVDFFAGSGTTLHAVNLLNSEDGGHRRCVMVTNNEVSDSEAKTLTRKGFNPGDEEWERLGIARYVTWPRTVCSIEGHDINGEPLKGNYIGSNIPMADGFEANAAFFKLGFLDKNAVALGRQFRELLPVLWMKTNCIGPCPKLEKDNLPTMLILPENKFAVLIDEKYYSEFNTRLVEHPEIKTVYIITDSESAYREMILPYDDKDCYQLYRDYLDNFRINTGRLQ
jgi:adenine-specific DNA-methyltransferase